MNYNKDIISKEYYDLLLDYSNQLSTLVCKLESDKSFTEQIQTMFSDKLPDEAKWKTSTFVLFDLAQIFKILIKGELKKESIETFGFVVLIMKIINRDGFDSIIMDIENFLKIQTLRT